MFKDAGGDAVGNVRKLWSMKGSGREGRPEWTIASQVARVSGIRVGKPDACQLVQLGPEKCRLVWTKLDEEGIGQKSLRQWERNVSRLVWARLAESRWLSLDWTGRDEDGKDPRNLT